MAWLVEDRHIKKRSRCYCSVCSLIFMISISCKTYQDFPWSLCLGQYLILCFPPTINWGLEIACFAGLSRKASEAPNRQGMPGRLWQIFSEVTSLMAFSVTLACQCLGGKLRTGDIVVTMGSENGRILRVRSTALKHFDAGPMSWKRYTAISEPWTYGHRVFKAADQQSVVWTIDITSIAEITILCLHSLNTTNTSFQIMSQLDTCRSNVLKLY